MIKLIISSQQAKLSSLGGPLGQRGINAKEFCDSFNKETKFKNGIPLCVKIYFKDGRYHLLIKNPSTTYLIGKCREINLKIIYEIALVVSPQREKVRETCTQLIGSCKSMNIAI